MPRSHKGICICLYQVYLVRSKYWAHSHLLLRLLLGQGHWRQKEISVVCGLCLHLDGATASTSCSSRPVFHHANKCTDMVKNSDSPLRLPTSPSSTDFSAPPMHRGQAAAQFAGTVGGSPRKLFMPSLLQIVLIVSGSTVLNDGSLPRRPWCGPFSRVHCAPAISRPDGGHAG